MGRVLRWIRAGVRTLLVVGTLLAGGTGPVRGAGLLPEPLPGWRVDVVLAAPQLRHPTVVACAPDGRVFVAEDPMDISTPKADAREGRILCIHRDGRVTVFAEGLHAVFGLQYLEGRVYVLHNPKFSVFDDQDGVGRNRRELIEQTLPEPWALNWNDHVPANFRLAMDGYFYVATGDKGLVDARGTDGSVASLGTGGIFRIRPDGSGLEVVSHGVRNILDVGLNSEDEQFTYDNTDEHDWMGRFTHMVEGGFYGYPHDFVPRRPYTLWMIEDYGAGAACGVLANTEDGLPPEYRDNLFLSDFGKRQILRVQVARDGATYRATAREDLFPNPPGDFRPVGITQSPDGRSLYICDWQHRDEKANVNVGRLLKLTWTGAAQTTPKPAWYEAAASGKPFDADTQSLVGALAHPSRSVRITAQRRLTQRGAAQELGVVLADRGAPPLARVHALWALDELRPSPTGLLLRAAADPDPMLRRQALRRIGLRRDVAGAPALLAGLNDPEPSVRFQAAAGLGRVGGTKEVPALVGMLAEPDTFTRYAVFTALNRIGRREPSAWRTVTQALDHSNERIRETARYAVRETYDLELVAALRELASNRGRSAWARREAIGLLAGLHHQPPPWKGVWWAYHPALQPPPQKTVAWSGTAPVLATLRSSLRESDAGIRRSAINALSAARDTASVPELQAVFPNETDPGSRATLLRALGAMGAPGTLLLAEAELRQRADSESGQAAIAALEAMGTPEAVKVLAGFVGTAGSGGVSLASAVAALGNLQASSAVGSLEPLSRHPTAGVRSAALGALAKVQGAGSLPALEAGLSDTSGEVRMAVVRALAELKSTNAIPGLLRAYQEPGLRAEAFKGLARTPDERCVGVLLEGLGSKNPTERNMAHLAVRNLGERVLGMVAARAGSLPPQALTELRQIYAGNPVAENGPIFTTEIRQATPEQYLEAAIQLAGGVANGRRLFEDAGGLNCIACHRAEGRGSDLGPDLSGAGTQFDRRALAEAILYPSKTVREGYQLITLELKGDEELSGVVKGESAEHVTLRDSFGREHKVARDRILARRNSALSLMPEGLQAALSLQEFADLVAYLSSLRGGPTRN